MNEMRSALDRREFLVTAAKAAAITQIGIGNAGAAALGDDSTSINDLRRKLSLDDDWKFTRGDIKDGQSPSFDDSSWQLLHVPHDWSIAGPFAVDNPCGPLGGYLPGGIGWYRKHLTIPPGITGKSVLLEFDGVYMNSEVWINGHSLGLRPYGYSSFAYDLTPHLKANGDINVIAVRVDNSAQPNSRWYTGSGIYRHVWLHLTPPTCIDHWGTNITTPVVSSESAVINLVLQLRNVTQSPRTELTVVILDAGGHVVANARSYMPSSSGNFSTTLNIKRPRLWSPDDPNLYTARTTLLIDGKPVDRVDTPFGIRTFKFDPNNGFSLNGNGMKLRGMCLHHDFGALGSAYYDAAARRRLQQLKDIGCNAIRMTHNPAAPQLLDLCDQMGFMVIAEAFDEWSVGKVQSISNGYHLYFNEWAERDLRDMILRDRNHPSIILWSIGNEIPDKAKPSGVTACAMLAGLARKLDPTRPVTAGVNYIESANKSGYSQLLDVVGYNGGGGSAFFYDADHAEFPERKMYGSEVPHTSQTRGVYVSNDAYCSSYDETFIDLTCEDSWRLTRDKNYIAGEFRWIGFDYLGEPTKHKVFHIPAREKDASWPSRSSNAGVFDTCGFAKDSAYFYQSQWTEKPMLHLFPHWSWNVALPTPIRVWCYSNCDVVELFLNDESLGKKYVFKDGEMHLEWAVFFQPGTLKAVGWKNGQKVCEETLRTAGAAEKIVLTAEMPTMNATGRDLTYLRAMIADNQGTMLPDANHIITFSIDGPAELIAVDNGDPDSHSIFNSNKIDAFHGLCIAIVRSTRNPGKVTVRAHAEGLEPTYTIINSIQPT